MQTRNKIYISGTYKVSKYRCFFLPTEAFLACASNVMICEFICTIKIDNSDIFC